MTADATTGERRIVVGVDGSPQSKKALRWGAYVASTSGGVVEAVIAWEYPPSFGWASIAPDWAPAKDMEKLLSETIHEVFGDKPPAGLRQEVREGGAAEVLIEASRGANLLVVGSRGHGGFAGLLLGSVSANVAEHSACPVLIVHGDQEPGPVS